MGYYHIPIDEESQKLCTTILPWGKYQYKRLPMGLANAPDIFQQVMTDILGDLDFVIIYIDDILITSNGTYKDHLEKLEIVLQRLEQKGCMCQCSQVLLCRGRTRIFGLQFIA